MTSLENLEMLKQIVAYQKDNTEIASLVIKKLKTYIESRPQLTGLFLGSPIVSRFITFTCCDIASTILEMPQLNFM